MTAEIVNVFTSCPCARSHLDVVLCDLDLGRVDVVHQVPQRLSVHLSDLHLLGLALAHIPYGQKHTHRTVSLSVTRTLCVCVCVYL